MSKAPLDIAGIDETKLGDSFPDFQFHMENYQFPPFRRDRHSKRGGKLVFVKNGFIAKRVKDLETKVSETICIELTISKKKWCILFPYKPPKQNSVLFFQEISNSLNQLVNKYENIFLAGDLNIDLLDSKSDLNNHFFVLRDMYDQTNLVKVPTCYKNLKSTLTDALLTNRPNNFQKAIVCETGLSDCHMLIATTLRSTFVKLPPKTVTYRSYKNFNENVFLHELDQKLIQGDWYRSDDLYLNLTEIFLSILDKHAPVKSKQIRGNQAPFVNKSLVVNK